MPHQFAPRCLALGVLLTLAGCRNSPKPAPTGSALESERAGKVERNSSELRRSILIDAGTVLDVALDQTVGSKTNSEGDHFSASLASPIVEGDRVLLPGGTKVDGSVTVAHSAGRFKGHAALGLALDSITVSGTAYPIQATSVERAGKGRGKRTGVGAGGGAVLGLLVGGLAGGGKGAAIGAAAGAGAGAAGAAYTGNRDITFPAETRLSFKLTQPLSIAPK
jgi:hypothetical protein